MKLAIIPCGKKKIWDKDSNLGPVTAKEAYIGTLHRLCEQYAELFCDKWVVLSAKHGFLLPTDIVNENYDLTFNMNSNQIISKEALRKQIKQKQLSQFEEIIVLTGEKYKPIIQSSFSEDHIIAYPLLGSGGIGFMQQRLKQAIKNNRPIQ